MVPIGIVLSLLIDLEISCSV